MEHKPGWKLPFFTVWIMQYKNNFITHPGRSHNNTWRGDYVKMVYA